MFFIYISKAIAEKDIKDNPGGIIIFSKNRLLKFIFSKSFNIKFEYLIINSGNIVRIINRDKLFFNLLKIQVIKKTYNNTEELKKP